MPLRIGEVIVEKRKKKAWTQEQLAHAVGVSTPAVSKWENNAAYPDITLLSPIARALDTSLDELLSYQAELSAEEISQLTKRAVHAYESQGFDEGWAMSRDLIKEYPNSLGLKFQLGGLLQSFLIFKPKFNKEEIHACYKQAAQLYEDVLDSKNPQYTYPAIIKLVGCYTMLQELERAEELLDSLPKVDVDPNAIYPSIYFLKGERDSAIKLTQGNIRRYTSLLGQSLSILLAEALEDGNYEKACSIADINLALAKQIGVGEERAYMNVINSMLARGDAQSALYYMEEFAQHIATLTYDYTENPVLDRLNEPEYDIAYTQRILAKSFLMQISEFTSLLQEPRYIAVAKQMHALAESKSQPCRES